MQVEQLKRNTYKLLHTIFKFPYRIYKIINHINVKQNDFGFFGEFYYIKTCFMFTILFNYSFWINPCIYTFIFSSNIFLNVELFNMPILVCMLPYNWMCDCCLTIKHLFGIVFPFYQFMLDDLVLKRCMSSS